MTQTDTTQTQRRAVCPACFAEQAITKGGRLVAHGYTRPQSWHSNVGTCSGAGLPHFGLEAGREATSKIAARLREIAATTRARIAAVLDGSGSVEQSERVRGTARVVLMVLVENPTAAQRAGFAKGLEQAAAHAIANAIELEARVAAWVAVEPRIVAVEKKAPIMHWRSTHHHNRGGKACAGSVMALHVGTMTTEIAAVTCPKCLERQARWTAAK